MQRPIRRHEDAVVAALAGGKAARSSIVASWARSMNVHGLDPTRRPRDERMTEEEFAAVRERMEPVALAARPTMERLFQAVGAFGASVILANSDGIPVERLGKSSEDRDFAAAGLWIGTRWSEAAAGTNGIGTGLAEGRPVVIHRDQHFLAANIGLTCASAPVHDAVGELVAVLDVSTVRADLGEALAGLVSHSVTEAARKIEADIFHRHFPRARMVLVPGLDRGLGALLAVDADELVIGATRAARQHLDLSGDLASNPVPVADLLALDSHDRPQDGERAVIARALARAGGNVTAAARALGVSRATLHRKLGRSG
ncbi:MAG: sigma-54-dependent Fis family transcriptional regulator [Rhodobacteraceae bacterium]|jgi:transcriptional regulator of acetoin/glycerol metabolism|nr:sigma-54-dependent Fis family transcriptional regulator [Paracoccaceae bacterium]